MKETAVLDYLVSLAILIVPPVIVRFGAFKRPLNKDEAGMTMLLHVAAYLAISLFAFKKIGLVGFGILGLFWEYWLLTHDKEKDAMERDLAIANLHASIAESKKKNKAHFQFLLLKDLLGFSSTEALLAWLNRDCASFRDIDQKHITTVFAHIASTYLHDNDLKPINLNVDDASDDAISYRQSVIDYIKAYGITSLKSVSEEQSDSSSGYYTSPEMMQRNNEKLARAFGANSYDDLLKISSKSDTVSRSVSERFEIIARKFFHYPAYKECFGKIDDLTKDYIFSFNDYQRCVITKAYMDRQNMSLEKAKDIAFNDGQEQRESYTDDSKTDVRPILSKEFAAKAATAKVNTVQQQATSNTVENDNNKITKDTGEDSDIAFCRYCGHKIQPDAVYCEKCGSKIR